MNELFIPYPIVLLAIVSNFLLLLAWLLARRRARVYWKRWNYFETHFNLLYKKWLKTLSKEELLRVQQHAIDKNKEPYQFDEPLNEPI